MSKPEDPTMIGQKVTTRTSAGTYVTKVKKDGYVVTHLKTPSGKVLIGNSWYMKGWNLSFLAEGHIYFYLTRHLHDGYRFGDFRG